MAGIANVNELSDQQIGQLTERLLQVPGLVAAYLHGSAVKGRMRPQSDVDIALLYRAPSPSSAILLDLALELETCVGRQIHLGVLSCESLIYATEVYQHGRQLICHDENLKDQFFMRLLSTYADFNRSRSEVLEAYLVREADDGYSTE